jgi:carboxyl-terminal processing protease
MVQEVNETTEQHKPLTTVKKSRSVLPLLLVAVLIFASGWVFGKGKVTIGGLKSGKVVQTSGGKLDYTSIDEVYATLKDNFDGTIDTTKATDGLKGGLAKASGDPYTEYFNSEDSKSFQEELQGSFEGIGAELGKDGANVVIISPIAGSPAEKVGLKPKDILIQIDGKPATDITISEAVKRIRGKAGTDVKLTLARDGVKVEVTITRAKITVPSVKWEVKDSIGILTVSRFSDDTADLARQAAKEFADKKVTGIVLDLRSDPGGLLDAAVKLSSLWLDNGKTVLLEKRGGKVQHTYTATGTPTLKGIKTVVLINDGSASASEITAGALHDNNAAKLMGIKSYGKGSVQQILQLDGGGTLKVTIARWYTPNDKNIDKEGIVPDTEVKRTDDDIKAARDPQMDAALVSVK